MIEMDMLMEEERKKEEEERKKEEDALEQIMVSEL